MFCPKCATQNVEGASFCRACGANISRVPQALTGQLPTAPADDRYLRRHRKRGEPTIDEAIRHLLMGVGFVVVSLAIARYGPAGRFWWIFLLIPAFSFLGRGVADFIRAREIRSTPIINQPQMPGAPTIGTLPPRQTEELRPPVPSVTEGTTRHLNAEPPSRHFDPLDSQKPS